MKRMLDLAVAVPGLLLALPLLVFVAALIRMEDGGPALFLQQRIGQFGQPFFMWKLRTMVSDASQRGGSLTVGHDPRITRVGYWLRRFKLDELPQLWNVVKGDMSLVGPRPEVSRYVRLYTPEQRRVLALKPGITDPASIRFCREGEILGQASDPHRVYVERIMQEKLRMNLQYARTACVRKDLAILFRTVKRILAA